MEFHEVANLFPMMQDDEFKSLCSDITKRFLYYAEKQSKARNITVPLDN